jgi:ribonuclease-3
VQEARVLAEFSKQYAITFRDPGLLKLALTHRSYLSVTGQGPRESNERLEFLGDSVLGLVTSEYLYRRHPDDHEGQLTKTKSLLVSKAILSRRALRMGLGRFVLMSHSEVESGGRQRLSILADAFESVLGAVYLDQGFEIARKFIHQWLLAESDAIVSDKRHTNYKSHLQEYVQSTYRTHPVYRIRSEYGPDHSKHFMVEVMVGRRTLGEGRGHNKKEAEQAAARDALERVEKLRRDTRAPKAREDEDDVLPEAGSGAETAADSGDGRRRRRGRRSRGRDREAPPAGSAVTGAAGTLEAPGKSWEESEEPSESDEFDATDDEEVVEVFEDDEDLEDGDADDEDGQDEDDDDEEDDDEDDDESLDAGSSPRGQQAAGNVPPHEQALVDPFGVDEPAAGEPAAERTGAVSEEQTAKDAEDREARIDEIERAMANFGRREPHSGGQRYGRKGRRGR